MLTLPATELKRRRQERHARTAAIDAAALRLGMLVSKMRARRARWWPLWA